MHFTRHALEKFDILRRHGFLVSKKDVVTAVANPDFIDRSRSPLKIAQRSLDKGHVLRVVYKEEHGMKIIITFYPGRASQYEKK